MAHDDKHKSKHAIAGEDLLVASDISNDSTVTGASIAAALNTLKDSITAESIWNHAAGVITPQDTGDKTLDFSGIGANDFTLKIPAAQAFRVNDGTNDVFQAQDGYFSLFAGGTNETGFYHDGGAFVIDTDETGGITLRIGSNGIFNINFGEMNWAPGYDVKNSIGSGKMWYLDDGTNSFLKAKDGSLDFSAAAAETILRLKHYAQISQPALTNNGEMTLWEDTDDSSRTYLIVRTNAGDKKVELS